MTDSATPAEPARCTHRAQTQSARDGRWYCDACGAPAATFEERVRAVAAPPVVRALPEEDPVMEERLADARANRKPIIGDLAEYATGRALARGEAITASAPVVDETALIRTLYDAAMHMRWDGGAATMPPYMAAQDAVAAALSAAREEVAALRAEVDDFAEARMHAEIAAEVAEAERDALRAEAQVYRDRMANLISRLTRIDLHEAFELLAKEGDERLADEWKFWNVVAERDELRARVAQQDTALAAINALHQQAFNRAFQEEDE